MRHSTVGVALWAMVPDGSVSGVEVKPSLEVVMDGYVEGGVGDIKVNNPGIGDRIRGSLNG